MHHNLGRSGQSHCCTDRFETSGRHCGASLEDKTSGGSRSYLTVLDRQILRENPCKNLQLIRAFVWRGENRSDGLIRHKTQSQLEDQHLTQIKQQTAVWKKTKAKLQDTHYITWLHFWITYSKNSKLFRK